MAKEYIEREELLEYMRKSYCKICTSKNKPYQDIICRACSFDDAIDYIEDFQTADVVEVVRCRDCKYWKDEEYCIVWNDVPVASDFCSYGERKEN